MSATNHTTNYNLPQFVGTDKPAWLGDVNPALSAIDTQMKANADAATAAAGDAATADGKAVIAQNGVNSLNATLNVNEYNSVSASTFIITPGLTPTGNFYIAQNADGSLFKFYGQINIANGSDTDVNISCSPIPGLSGVYGIYIGSLNAAPESAYQVVNSGLYLQTAGSGAIEYLWGAGFAVDTAGGVYLYNGTSSTITIPAHKVRNFKFFPCVYFNKNFGDQ